MAGGPSLTAKALSPGCGNARPKNGPTVCPGVQDNSAIVRTFDGGSAATTDHDVPAVAGGVLRLGEVMVVTGDQPLPGRGVDDRLEDGVQLEHRVDDRLEDGVQLEHRVAGKVH